jgi:hypothetical protein
MCVDDESIDDDPKLWWACQAIILDVPAPKVAYATPRCASRVSVPYIDISWAEFPSVLIQSKHRPLFALRHLLSIP